MGSTKQAMSAWETWLWWVIASAAGGAAGFAAASGVLNLLGSAAYSTMAGVIVLTLLGAGLGLAQSLVLRSVVGGALAWLAATTLGGLVAGIVIAVIGNVDNLVLAYAGMGFILAVLQWSVLAHRLAGTWVWLLASPLGWAVGALAMQVLGRSEVQFAATETVHLVRSYGVMSAVGGMVTGIVLIWLLHRRQGAA